MWGLSYEQRETVLLWERASLLLAGVGRECGYPIFLFFGGRGEVSRACAMVSTRPLGRGGQADEDCSD